MAPAPRAPDGLTFALGSLALLLTQEQPRTQWCGGGISKSIGLVQRVPVYQLDDGYWDCYREEELQVA